MCVYLQMELARVEMCDFMPFHSPKKVHMKLGHIAAIEFCRTEQVSCTLTSLWECEAVMCVSVTDVCVQLESGRTKNRL